MKQLIVAMAVTGSFAAAFVGPATAAAAPSQHASVTQTVAQLRAQGYTVIVDSAGSASLDQCTTYTVRPGNQYSRMDSGFPGAGNDLITEIVSMTVYIHTQC